jgi:hypothetical protein
VLEAIIATAILLLIVNLVARDRIEFRISRLRSELMSLRSEEKRLKERRKEVDRLAAQIDEAVERSGHRGRSANQEGEAIAMLLRRLYLAILETELKEEQLHPPRPEKNESTGADAGASN